jgi:hypothetical protein
VVVVVLLMIVSLHVGTGVPFRPGIE